jgi:DNA transformation protein
MRNSDSFRDFVLDQLSGIAGVRARAMFGGIGLYAGDIFFGLIASDVLYLKVDDSNRAQYVAVKSEPFKPYEGKPMTMPYYNVPAGVLEDPRTLTNWARASVRVASARAAAKRKRS